MLLPPLLLFVTCYGLYRFVGPVFLGVTVPLSFHRREQEESATQRQIFTDITSPFFSITLIFFAFFPRLYKTWEIRKESQLLLGGHVVMTSYSLSLSLSLSLSQMWDSSSSSSILDIVMASVSTVSIYYQIIFNYVHAYIYYIFFHYIMYFGGYWAKKG